MRSGVNDGLIGFFVESCPPAQMGWAPFSGLYGRLALSVDNHFQAGDSVGFALGDGEDRGHTHVLSGTINFGSHNILATSGFNLEAAHSGPQPALGFLATSTSNASGIPFLQLTTCRFSAGKGDGGLSLPVGTIAIWDPASATGGCSVLPSPSPGALAWQAFEAAAGRLMAVSGSPELLGQGYIVSTASPLPGPGADFSHQHSFTASVVLGSTSFVGIDTSGDNDPASDGTQSVTEPTGAADSALPYLSVLTCNLNASSSAGAAQKSAAAPLGFVLLSSAGAPCPPGFAPLADTLSGRFVVGTPVFGVPSRTFGGAAIPSNGAHGDWQPNHLHSFSFSITTSPAGVGLASGCCANGYGAQGSYTANGNTAVAGANIPWVLVQACVSVNATM